MPLNLINLRPLIGRRLRTYRTPRHKVAAELTLGLLIAGAGSAFAADPVQLDRMKSTLIEQGRYLAAVGDCVSCHTRPNGALFSGGRPLNTPFGVIYSANITPDPNSGIGGWSEKQFARAMHEGIAANGERLYPAFPYTAYTKVTDQDVHAIYAFLRSVKSVSYTPPKNEMTFPFSVRALLAGWNMLFFQPGRYAHDPSQSEEWNRGAYLIQGLGHCGACHTPRNLLGGTRESQSLTGGVYLDEIADEVVDNKITPMDEKTVRLWSTPNLTSAASGLGAWSFDDIVLYLKDGHNARAGALGPMNEVISNSTRHLSDPDIYAIATFLKSLPPATNTTLHEAAKEVLRTGEIVYTTRCADCHLPTGLGVPRQGTVDASKTAPALAGNAVLQASDPATLINIVLYGAHDTANLAGSWPKMSGFELSVGLDDDQIAALCTYVRSSWGNHAGPVDAASVARQR